MRWKNAVKHVKLSVKTIKLLGIERVNYFGEVSKCVHWAHPCVDIAWDEHVCKDISVLYSYWNQLTALYLRQKIKERKAIRKSLPPNWNHTKCDTQCHFEPYELYYCERTRFHEPLCEFPLIVLHISSQRAQITLATTMLAPFVLFRFSIALFWCHHFIIVLYRTQLELIIHVGIL